MSQQNIVFDVGCHKGEDAEYYLKKGYKVIAFECSPKNIALLKKKFETEISSGKIIIEKRALVAQDGEAKKIKFYQSTNSVWGTTKSDWKDRNERLGDSSKCIEIDTLDSKKIFDIYGLPYYIKIDIEGSDREILYALLTLKKEKRPFFLSIESEKVSWNNLLKEMDLLQKLGYKKFKVISQSKNRFKVSKWINSNGEIIKYHHQRHSSGPFGEDLGKNNWLTYHQVISKYKKIFILYKLFGDDGIFAPRKIKIKKIRSIYSKILTILQLRDWYDTHASSIN